MKRILLAVICAVLLLAGCGVQEDKAAFAAASKLLEERQYAEAEAAFSRLADREIFTAQSYRGMGIAQLMRSAYSESSISFAKAKLNGTQLSPEFQRDVDKYLAYCALKLGKQAEAEETYDRLIGEKEEADILYMRGRLRMADGRIEEAGEDFTAAASLSTDYNLFISIYELYTDYNMHADGAEFLNAALELTEKEKNDHYGRGVIQYYLENYTQAKEELIAALRADPDDAQAVLLLGKTYLAMDEAANARAMYREHLENPECAAAAYNGLAMCDLKEGNYDSALRNIVEGLSLKDSKANESLLYNEIIVYEHKQDWETARIKAASFAAQYPTNEAGQRENAFLSSR